MSRQVLYVYLIGISFKYFYDLVAEVSRFRLGCLMLDGFCWKSFCVLYIFWLALEV